MSLQTDLEQLEILRKTGEPDGTRPVCIAIHGDDLRRLPVWLRRRPQLRLSHLLILPSDNPQELAIKLPEANGRPEITDDPALLNENLDADIVMLFPRYGTVVAASMKFSEFAKRKIYLSGHIPEQFAKRTPIPDFYSKNSAKLEQAYALLRSSKDREAFARRVKALETGDSGWLAIAPFFEYEHPEICPATGDVMIDGGISDMVGAQIKFARAVGPQGAIHGFEPIDWMAKSAAESLSAYPCYHLYCAGLAEKDGSAEFSSLRDSSHIGAQAGAQTVRCKLRSIDSVARQHNLDQIDCIKLDIEGAELSALKGAANIIRRDKPKLIICLYHKPADLYEIPLYLHGLVPEYAFEVAHSSAGFTDTILYAQAK